MIIIIRTHHPIGHLPHIAQTYVLIGCHTNHHRQAEHIRQKKRGCFFDIFFQQRGKKEIGRQDKPQFCRHELKGNYRQGGNYGCNQQPKKVEIKQAADTMAFDIVGIISTENQIANKQQGQAHQHQFARNRQTGSYFWRYLPDFYRKRNDKTSEIEKFFGVKTQNIKPYQQ